MKLLNLRGIKWSSLCDVRADFQAHDAAIGKQSSVVGASAKVLKLIY